MANLITLFGRFMASFGKGYKDQTAKKREKEIKDSKEKKSQKG